MVIEISVTGASGTTLTQVEKPKRVEDLDKTLFGQVQEAAVRVFLTAPPLMKKIKYIMRI